MMSNYRLIYLLFCLIPGLLNAQTLRGLYENPVIRERLSGIKPELKFAESSAQLSLPFFEDFSTSSVVPDPSKWTDRYVFINNSFAVNPVSVGVATFDAIDQNGKVYAVKGTPVSSDTLTSGDFDLSAYKDSGEQVRLSFFYQCGGRGEVPEFSDSLVLEFYNPAELNWHRVWFVTDDQPSEFIQVILVIDNMYYADGFRFRFRNYTSLSAEEVDGGEGALSNADIWNIDYILMNTESEYFHTTLNNDITITDIPRNLLDLYETIPWNHLNSAVPTGLTRNSIIYGIRNYMPEGDSSNVGRSYYVKNFNTGNFQDYQPPWDEQLPNGVLVFRELPLIASISRNDNLPEGRIEIASYLRTLDFGPRENDTSKVLLHFTDKYVYDDGSPEYGFGIEGPSMTGALLAMRFRVFEPDTLTSVEIVFNMAHNRFNETLPFQICVWQDGGGKPGDLIYISEEYYYPDFNTPIPGLKRYPVPGNLATTDSIIYIGMKQQTEEFLNIGYDVNNDNLSRIFVNTSGSWISPGGSLIPGTVMMRAVFETKGVVSGGGPEQERGEEISVFPNPASDVLFIQSEIPVRKIIITDVSGRVVLQQNGPNESVSITNLTAGLYQVIIVSGTSKTIIKKIIISR